MRKPFGTGKAAESVDRFWLAEKLLCGIEQASQAALLFQFGDLDRLINREEARFYFNVASEPKIILKYLANHNSVEWKGQEDRLQWLADQLGFAINSED